MRALALASFDVPAAMMDVPEPVAGPGEVLVRVHAASVNAYDLGVAGGFMKDYLPYEFPAVIGNDVAGTIEALGEGVDGFSVGDRVFGTMGSKAAIHDGAFAELANPQAAAVANTPDGAVRSGRGIARCRRDDRDERGRSGRPRRGFSRARGRCHRRCRDVRDPAWSHCATRM